MNKLFFDTIDWAALREQKTALLTIQGELTERPEYDAFEGLVSLLDTLMDMADTAGYPVVWSICCEYCDADMLSTDAIEIRDEMGDKYKVCSPCWESLYDRGLALRV